MYFNNTVSFNENHIGTNIKNIAGSHYEFNRLQVIEKPKNPFALKINNNIILSVNVAENRRILT